MMMPKKKEKVRNASIFEVVVARGRSKRGGTLFVVDRCDVIYSKARAFVRSHNLARVNSNRFVIVWTKFGQCSYDFIF